MTDPRRDVAERLAGEIFDAALRAWGERDGSPWESMVLDFPGDAQRFRESLAALLREPSEGREPRRPTDAEIDNACQNYRHDYFLLENEEQEAVRAEALEWLRSWIKVRESCPGWDSRRTPSDSPAGEVGPCPHCGNGVLQEHTTDCPAGEP